MSEEEAGLAYEKIKEILLRFGFDWAILQIEESINLGKTVKIKADASEFIEDSVVGRRRGRKQMQDFFTTQPFSNSERLDIVVDAIDRIAALPHFASDSIDILDVESITFVSEREDDEPCHLIKQSRDQLMEMVLRIHEIREKVAEPFT